MRYQSFYPFARQSPTVPPRTAVSPYWGSMPPNSMVSRQQQRWAMPPNSLGGRGPQSPSRLNDYMITAQQFLSTAQQFAPVIQQFAPMVQNLPAMWRLYKGLQSLPNANGSSSSTGRGFSRGSGATTVTEGKSVPRIYQPPN